MEKQVWYQLEISCLLYYIQITHDYGKRVRNKISVVITPRPLASSPFLFPKDTCKMNVITFFIIF